MDDGADMLSNPLMADPAKGLRSLATLDENCDYSQKSSELSPYDADTRQKNLDNC